MRKYVTAVLAAALSGGFWVAPAGPPIAVADTSDGYFAVGEVIAGRSWDNLGDWIVRYERVGGEDPGIAESINQVIDAEARGQVATYEPSATKTQPWTLDVNGALSFRNITISALFIGEYDTDMPNMPIRSVATRVFDKRSGILISWDNLFIDKRQGLTRIADQTRAILPTVYAAPRPPGGWQFGSEIAPLEDNFRSWIPTGKGIELHFPDGQFGRGAAVITVPWPAVADLLDPAFRPITE